MRINIKKYLIALYHFAFYIILSFKYFILCIKDLHRTSSFCDKEYKQLFFTNSQGGGTQRYTQSFLNNTDSTIVVENVSHVWLLCYKLYNNINDDFIYLFKFNLKIILQKKYDYVYINSLAFYRNVFNIQKKVKEYKKKYSLAKFVYMVHDYHSICPRLNLISNGKYCELGCANLKCDLQTTYGGFNSVTIKRWRFEWDSFFQIIDEIICFSQSSKDLLLYIYKELDEKKFYIKPHYYFGDCLSKIKQPDCKQWNVGIVGIINNEAKGLYACKEIITKSNEDISFVFIGTKESELQINKKNVKCLGRYSRDELENLVKEYKINSFIFPSICPETFSYVISELIMLDLPILSFDIGAQGERTKKYDKGHVFSNVNDLIFYLNHMSLEEVIK